MILRLELPMDPRPKQRAIVSLRNRRGQVRDTVRTFTPEATRVFEQEVRFRTQSELTRLRLPMPLIPSPAPVFVVTTFWLKRPKTGPASMLPFPTAGPLMSDADNLVKAVWDSLGEIRQRGELVRRGVLWTDDKQVVWGPPAKLWAEPPERPRITLAVADLEGMAELVRSESDTAIRRFSPASGPGAASRAVSR